MVTCPDGHESVATDFCDVCGLQIAGAGPAPATTVAAGPASPDETCPRCGESRSGRFCEGCSYDFVAGIRPAESLQAWSFEAESFQAQPSTRAQPPTEVTAAASNGDSDADQGWWTARVSADHAYYEVVRAETEDDPEVPEVPFPAFYPERGFALRDEQIRIGRRSRQQGLNPEIDLTGPPSDPGISHLHALLVARPAGPDSPAGWAVVDPGSTNGTTINDNSDPIAVDTPIPLHDGDRVHVGAWTTITVFAPKTPEHES